MQNEAAILVIDDEPNLRQTLAVILRRSGYTVVTAENAREGEEKLRTSSFDLIFLDLKLPDVNGLDLLPTIHEIHPDMPVVILTAHATLESAIEAVRRGARDYLLKPIDPQLILSRVCDVLAKQQDHKRWIEIVKSMQDLLNELNAIEGQAERSKPALKPYKRGDRARILQRGPIMLDLHIRQATLNGKVLSISPTAFDYLTTLVRHSPNTVQCEVLVVESQGYQATTVESQEMARWRIHELRKALEPNPKKPQYIITVRGAGYRLVA